MVSLRVNVRAVWLVLVLVVFTQSRLCPASS